MPTHMPKFVPSADELCLASRLLEMNMGSWNRSDYLSVETAIGIFKQSGISFKQIRDIWSIADKNGTGKLTKAELAVVIRLAGWIQAGKDLDEKLLEKEGPLPKIKGISDVVAPKIVHSFPLITSDDVAKLKEAFLQCNPVNGVLSKRSVMAAYMTAKPDLSFEALFRLMQLIDTENDIFDFKSFAVGLHIVRSLNSSLISSVPSSVPPEESKILDGSFWTGEGSFNNDVSDSIEENLAQSTNVEFPAQVDSDIKAFIEDIKFRQHISGKMALNFMSKYGINPTEIAQIWHQSDVEAGRALEPARIVSIEQLIRKRVAGQLSAPESLPPLRRYASQFPNQRSPPVTETVKIHSGISEHSESSIAKADPSSTTPYQMLHQPPSYDTSTTEHEHILGKFKDEVGRLTSQFETVVVDQRWAHTELRTHCETLRRENLHLKRQQQTLQHQLRTKEENCRKAEKFMDSLKLDLLEQQVISKEHQEAAINANSEAERLWSTVETQSRQITTLLELVTDMETTIMELNIKPESTDLRVRFLRATVRETEAAATNALGETLELRQIVSAREQEIVELRKCLEDSQKQRPVPGSNEDILSLRNGHEDLKTQMENMQRLLEHLMVSRAKPGTVDDEDTLVQPCQYSSQESESKPSFLKSSGLSHQLSSIVARGSNHDVPSAAFPSSPKVHPLPNEPSPSSTPDMTIYPFHLSRNISTASNLARSAHVAKKTTWAGLDDAPQDKLQLEDDLQLFRLHILRKGYIGIEMVERFISKYDLHAYSLDEIARFVGLDASVKRINEAVDLIRQAVICPRNHGNRILSGILDRSPSSTTTSSGAISSNSAQDELSKPPTIGQTAFTRFCAPSPSSFPIFANRSAPESFTSSVIASTMSTINSSVQSTRAVCNGVS